jgi:hypothetical protein
VGLTLEQAAHKLRMSVDLIRWFTRYSAKRDNRKLPRNADGTFDATDLESFDAHLWGPWPDKNPGKGILRELQWESRGRCGHCNDACDVRETAHINRLGVELAYHCQHPHNLMEMCPNCHSRYDVVKVIENATVKHFKRRLLSDLMAAVDRDVLMQKEIRLALNADSALERRVAEMERQISVLSNAQRLTYHAESVVTGSAQSAPSSTSEAEERLEMLSGSLLPQSPITSALLRNYAACVRDAELPTVESNVDEPFDEWKQESGVCLRCDESTSVESVCCAECGSVPAWPDHTELLKDGSFAIYKEVWQYKEPDTVQILCEHCESAHFEVEFESLCDYCRHVFSKD